MKQIISAAAVSLLLASSAIAQDMPAGSPDKAAPAMNVEAPKFVEMASASNMFEIESSKLAQEKAPSEDVKQFAGQMITDHTKAGEDLKAATDNAPPMKLAPKQAAMMELLQNAQGDAFEQLYIDMQAQAHMEAVMLFRTYSGAGDDEQLVAFAKKTLPTLEQHMMHVKDLVAKH